MRKLIPDTYIDVCGRCVNLDGEVIAYANGKRSSEDDGCTGFPEKPVLTQAISAAAIGLIIIAAVIAGIAISASSIFGVKTLVDRASEAKGQFAHTNPLFEKNDAEQENPNFVEEKDDEDDIQPPSP